ncbi:MAG: PTS sugar transporter subunit IIA [Xanthomonadales bacterium]|nr:PTS sugar transporter subunit IIA [Xanthomonadales bacterium]
MSSPSSASRCDERANSKKRLLERLAQLLTDDGDPERERAIYDSLCARERLGSTALGHGVAIPHGRCPAVSTAVGAFVRLDQPIDFQAADQQPVDLIFGLVVPEHFTDQHLLLLSQLAEMLSEPGFAERLRRASDRRAVLALLAERPAPPRKAVAAG